jgi:hypothetical protein
MHFDSLYPIQRAIAQAIADGKPITARELREAALACVEAALTMTPEEAQALLERRAAIVARVQDAAAEPWLVAL